jgi:hypothetical protein
VRAAAAVAGAAAAAAVAVRGRLAAPAMFVVIRHAICAVVPNPACYLRGCSEQMSMTGRVAFSDGPMFARWRRWTFNRDFVWH